jgi:hypothetical protein
MLHNHLIQLFLCDEPKATRPHTETAQCRYYWLSYRQGRKHVSNNHKASSLNRILGKLLFLP